MRNSLHLNNVVKVDNTGKIIDIPEINVDITQGRVSKDSSLDRDLEQITPWMEEKNSSPTKTSGTFSSSNSSRGFVKHASESQSTLFLPSSSSQYTQGTSIRKVASSLFYPNTSSSSKVSINGTSSPPTSSSSGPRQRLRSLIKRKSSKGLKQKPEDHPSLNPPVPELPTPKNSLRKREKDGDFLSGSMGSSAPDEVIMTLDTDLEKMDGIVDSSVLISAPSVNVIHTTAPSIRSISDDKHSLHSHRSSMTNNNPHLGLIKPSDFHNPFSLPASNGNGIPFSSDTRSLPPATTSSPPRVSSLANLEKTISPRTVIAEANEHKKFVQRNVLPPTSNNGLHGGSLSVAPQPNNNNSAFNSDPNSDHAHPWVPPESWVIDLGAPEVESDYSSSEDDMMAHGTSPIRSNGDRTPGSGSIGSLGLGGRGTVGGGRPLVFAQPPKNDYDDDDDDDYDMGLSRARTGVDELGRRIPPTDSVRSFSTTNTSTTVFSASRYTPSISGSIASTSNGTEKKGKRKFIEKRKNSNPNPVFSSADPSIRDDIDSLGTLASHSSSLGVRRPSHQGQQSSRETFKIRIYRANNTYHVVSCGFNVTVAMLQPALNAKLLLGEERETHKLYLKERGRERILGQTERPADIVRRRLEQAGYDATDGIELLRGEGLAFLLKFVYKSQVFGPAEQSLNIENYEQVDLSGRSLRTIPVDLHQHAAEIISLSLSRNPMLDLPLDFIQSTSTSFTELRLSHMALKKVPPNIRFATSLTRLDLSSNRIGDLDDAYIDHIPGLKVLKVQNNRMEKLPWHLPRLRKLTDLNISNNKFKVLPVVVCRLESLRDLDISFNNILELPEEIGDLRNLEHLIMVGNQITSIPPKAESLVSLRRLDCRRNAISDMSVIGMLPKLEMLSTDHNRLSGVDLCLGPCLKAIEAGYNEITELRVTGSIDNPGPYTALFSLDVSHAKLSSISSRALSSLPSLRVLNLSHNTIKTLPPTLGDLEYLETLKCADNILERLPEGIGRLRKLEILDVHENNLTELPGELWACASLIKLNATSNMIEKWEAPCAPPPTTQLQSHSPGSTTEGDPDADSLNTLDKRKTSVVSVSNTSSGSRLPSLAYALEKLYLGENQLTADALGFLSLFPELKVLNLSFNLIQDLPPTFFKNFLSEVPPLPTPPPSWSASTPTLHSQTQKSQPTQKSCLEELYLSGNRITTLPTEELARMTRMTTLFLNGNRLQTLPQELGKVTSLMILDVGSNLLKYNIYNWEFDWNWNFNKNLKYLNLSGNKHLQIKSDYTKLGHGGSRHSRDPGSSAAAIRQQSLGGFSDLAQIRVLGLMDITITTTGQTADIPDEHEDRRIRTSESTVCGMAYGIADTLGRNEHLNMLDLVHEFPSARKDEALFAIFGRSHPPKAMPAGISGNKIAKYLRDNFVKVFKGQLNALKKERAEGYTDALRRSFLKINQNLHDELFSNRKQVQASSSSSGIVGSNADITDAFVSRGGASGAVLYFRGKTMYIANVGDALAVVSRGGKPRPVSLKHDPYHPLEISRIRAAEGWISPEGLVNDEIDISRSFGFFHLPPINARPDITTWELSEQDEFVIIANRGLWDFVSYKTAVDIARRDHGEPMLAAQKLRDFALSYGADGSTMIMVISVSDLFTGRSRENSIADPQMYKPINSKTRVPDRSLARLKDEPPAPEGHIALVFTDIRNSTHLWDVNRGMNTAWRLHNTLLRRTLRFCGGYEVKTEGDSFMCAFPTTMQAVWWCLTVQMELLEQEWPLEILECEDGKQIYDLDNRLIAQGLSVRMGIHCGSPLCEVDPVNHRMDYFGPMVNRSARINSSAAGGQIMCSQEVIREIKAQLLNGSPTLQSNSQPHEAVDNVRKLGVTIIDIGEVKLKGLELPEQLSAIYPAHLGSRSNLRDTVVDPGASGSRVQFSVSQIRQLGLVCLRLESLATSRIFREIAERKSSIQTISEQDHDEEEDLLYIYGDPNLLLPPLDEKTSTDRDMTLVLDSLSGRIENAIAKIREKANETSVKDSLISALNKKGCIDERTLQSILSIVQGI